MNIVRIFMTGIVTLLVTVLTPLSSGALAHSQSYGYLTVNIGDRSIDGSLDLAARDLNTLFNLDADQDGKLTWGEFRGREAEIIGKVLGEISIGAENSLCGLQSKPALTESRGGETYIVIPFSGACPKFDGPIELSYRLLFNVDAQHRGLVAVTTKSGTQSFVLTPATTRVALSAGSASRLAQFLTYVAHGAHHIWIGYDHILFLITLLLGTLTQAKHGSPRQILTDSVKVVTAFTLSHSVTLALAALGILTIPVELAESLIVATIAIAAINNIWPILSRRIWLVALAFGLIHGVGFANVLSDLGLPRDRLLEALLAFNIGVELGQLAIVAAALPLIALAFRFTYSTISTSTANLAIAAIGALWFGDRALGTAVLPF
jgi:hypothetical protein